MVYLSYTYEVQVSPPEDIREGAGTGVTRRYTGWAAAIYTVKTPDAGRRRLELHSVTEPQDGSSRPHFENSGKRGKQ